MATRLSYCSAPLLEPYIYQSVPDRLRTLALQNPHQEAFVGYDAVGKRTAISREQLYNDSVSLAKSFVSLGLNKGDNVGICMNNSMNSLLCNMAVTCAGGVTFYMSTQLSDGSDIIDTMNRIKCKFLLMDTEFDDNNWRILENVWPIESKQSAIVPTLKTIVCNGEHLPFETSVACGRQSLSTLMERVPDENIRLPDVLPEDILVNLCTSGSSGEPKEIVITHFGIINWTKQSNKVFHISGQSRFFNERTFSWVFGYPRTYIAEGSTRVFVDPKLTFKSKNIDVICDIIEKEKCDVAYLPGYMVADLQESDVELSTKFRHVDTVIQGGERIPAKRVEFLKGRYCKRVLIYYGTTESGGNSAFASDDLAEYEDGIIGLPLDGCELKVVDDLGNTVPMGTSGEICVRSNWGFNGYRNMDEIFRQTVDSSNWFHTKDMGHMRADGNFVVDGRRVEIVTIQTNKFYPWAIEQVLKQYSAAEQVFAVGVPDERMSQVFCACVLPKSGMSVSADDVKQFCDTRFLDKATGITAGVKPVHYLILDSIPMLSSGKFDRRKLAKIAKDRLGL